MAEKYPPAWACDLARKMRRNRIRNNDLAAELGVSYQYISMVLNGERKPESGKGTKENMIAAVDAIIDKRKRC